MVKQGVLEKVHGPSDWVNSMVVIQKKDGSLRTCIDPNDLSKALKRMYYQLPTVEEITARMPGARFFSMMDARSGYWQVPLDEESSKLTTFNTPFGRFRFTRMPFGIRSAQEVFHKRVHEIFEDIQGVKTDIDDILVWGRTLQEHDDRLNLRKSKRVQSKVQVRKVPIQEYQCWLYWTHAHPGRDQTEPRENRSNREHARTTRQGESSNASPYGGLCE